MRCPVCNREFESETSTALPFCSERCRTIDLGRWLGEAYQLPVVPDPEADEVPETVRRENGAMGLMSRTESGWDSRTPLQSPPPSRALRVSWHRRHPCL